MFLIRDITYCHPGKARPMVEKFKALAKATEGMGMGRMRIMTDVSAERFWTVVSEVEVTSIEDFTALTRQAMSKPELQAVMEGYHDLISGGRREIYMLEA